MLKVLLGLKSLLSQLNMLHQIGSFNIAFIIYGSYITQLTYNIVTTISPSVVKRVDNESLG